MKSHRIVEKAINSSPIIYYIRGAGQERTKLPSAASGQDSIKPKFEIWQAENACKRPRGHDSSMEVVINDNQRTLEVNV